MKKLILKSLGTVSFIGWVVFMIIAFSDTPWNKEAGISYYLMCLAISLPIIICFIAYVWFNKKNALDGFK